MLFVQAWGPDAPTRPRLVSSLRRLGHNVDDVWPSRSRSSDGWIGDSAHQARESDHNPDARGLVHAVDITAKGVDPVRLVAALVVHPSTHYVIFRRLIYSRRNGFRAMPYTGTDPHTSHIHVSVYATPVAERSARPWLAL